MQEPLNTSDWKDARKGGKKKKRKNKLYWR